MALAAGRAVTTEVLAVDPPRQIAWRTIPIPLFVDSSDWRTIDPHTTR